MIKGIHHVALKCAGPDQFREVMIFYTEVIGLTVIRTWGSGENAAAMLGAGNCIVEVFASGQVSGSTGSINHFAFLTDDPDEFPAIGAVIVSVELGAVVVPSLVAPDMFLCKHFRLD